MIPINFLTFVALALFVLGALTALIRKNILMILMGLELMLNAAVLLFITYARMHAGEISQGAAPMMQMMQTAHAGHLFTLFIFVVAAVEVGLIIAIVLNIFKWKRSLLTSHYNLMRD